MRVAEGRQDKPMSMRGIGSVRSCSCLAKPGLRSIWRSRFFACGLVALALINPDTCIASESLQAGTHLAVLAVDKPDHHPRDNTLMKRQWGVEVLYVRPTAAGYMLEFRYKVLDADKARPLFERQTKPVLTHLESGVKMIVPTPAKTGALRNSNPPIAGNTYWMFFANPGKRVRSGDHVNIEIGEFSAAGIQVN